MNKRINALALAAVIALSLLASTSNALAKDIKAGRETAWTAWADLGPVADPQGATWEWILEPVGVTWEE